MENKKFKTLMIGGTFVDVNRLIKGIYISNKPFLYDCDSEKEHILDSYKKASGIMGINESGLKIIEHNLQMCTMVDIEMSFKLDAEQTK